MRIRAVSNFRIGPTGRAGPGLLGLEYRSGIVPVRGQRVNRPWLDETLAHLEDASRPAAERAESFVLVARTLTDEGADSALFDGTEVRALTARLAELYPTFDPVTRAWILSLMVPSRTVLPILDAGAESEDPAIRLTYLITSVRSMNDAAVEAAASSETDLLRRMAAHLRRTFEATDAERRSLLAEPEE